MIKIMKQLPYKKEIRPKEYSKVEDQQLDKNKIPIERGCHNKECFCTGKCHQIIGWSDKLPKEF